MTPKPPTIPRDQWQANQLAESRYWSNWLRDGVSGVSKEFADDLRWRTSENCDVSEKDMFAPYLRPACPPGSQARILDVGAGPLTWFPRKWLTRDYHVTAVDPLAAQFDPMLAEAKITPQFRTVKGEAESLDAQFSADSFHLVFCRNALEQFHDPLRAIGQMLKVVKPGCWVILLQEGYRTEDEKARGPWTLEESSADLFLHANSEKIDLALEFVDVATTRAIRSWHWPWVLGGLKKESL